MQTFQRERFRELLVAIQVPLRLCAANEAGAYEQALKFFADAQEALPRLRCPEAATLAALRAKLTSAHDGFRDPQVPGDLTPRKALRAAIAVYLGQAEELLRRQVSAINDRLEPLRQDLIKVVTVGRLMGVVPPLPPDGTSEAFLRHTWLRLQNEATQQMHAYLNTALPQIDRLYLLDEILSNARSDDSPSEPGAPVPN